MPRRLSKRLSTVSEARTNCQLLDIMTLVVLMNEMVVIWVICNHESDHESIQGKKRLFVSLLEVTSKVRMDGEDISL
jgi:hypothetical protein